MTLGARFPTGLLRASVIRQLRPGRVIKLVERMGDGKLHEKRFVVVHCDEDTAALVINSEISDYVRYRPRMLACQVKIDQASHPFMSWDSHVDCSAAHRYSTERVIQQLMDNNEWLLGSISDDLRHLIIAAMKVAPGITPEDLASYCDALEQAELS